MKKKKRTLMQKYLTNIMIFLAAFLVAAATIAFFKLMQRFLPFDGSVASALEALISFCMGCCVGFIAIFFEETRHRK